MLGNNPLPVLSFTAPESVGGVNGPEHSTVAVNGLRFADIYNVDDAYVIERNGLQTDPMSRENAMRTLRSVANSYLDFMAEQHDAEEEQRYEEERKRMFGF
jgi:hypothetical protein